MILPIALFCHSRPDHLSQTLNALRANPESGDCVIYAFSDGARNRKEESKVKKVRELLKSVRGFRGVYLLERSENLGLSQNIISGLNAVMAEHTTCTVLEDDIVTTPHFLKFVRESLYRFADDERVFSISAYGYPLQKFGLVPEVYFTRGIECWGWATWRRSWNLFEPDGSKLLSEIEAKDLKLHMDFEGTNDFTGMLRKQARGEIDSWAIRWYASAILQNKLSLAPGRTLVRNIGMDGTGVHSLATSLYDSELAETPIDLAKTPNDVIEDQEALKLRQAYFRSLRSPSGLAQRTWGQVKRMIRRAA